jgi:MATE family multidrug resistance protein
MIKVWNTFVTVGAALIARTAAGMTAYFAMATSAMGMGIVAAAAHQVAMQMFWFISYLPEPLSMAAQTLVAREYPRNPRAARRWAQTLVSTGTVFGLALSLVTVVTLTWGAGLFSRDRVIQQTVQSLAPLGGSAIAICSMLMMFDGISIGSRAFTHLPIGVAAGLIVVLGILHIGAPMGLSSVWWALNSFYSMRLAVHVYHYFVSRVFSNPSNDSNVFFIPSLYEDKKKE